MNHLFHIPTGLAHWLDGLSIAALIGSLLSVLPDVATCLTVVWVFLRVIDVALDILAKPAVREWLDRRKEPADE